MTRAKLYLFQFLIQLKNLNGEQADLVNELREDMRAQHDKFDDAKIKARLRQLAPPDIIEFFLKLYHEECEKELNAVLPCEEQLEPLPTQAAERDVAAADRLVAEEKGNLLYCYELKKWLVWDKRRWKEDTGQRSRMLMEKSMRRYVGKIAANSQSRDISEAGKCLDSHRITNALREAEKKLGVNAAQLDTHPMLLTFKNGTLNLETGELEPHQPEHLITKMIHYNYNAEAECPKFLTFLEHAVGKEALPYLQKLVGYTLTGDTSEKTFIIVWGLPDTGKTTFLDIVRSLLSELAVLLQVDTLMAKRQGSDAAAQEDLAALRGVRFASTSELDQNRKLSIGMINALFREWE
jgi:putative DNA primase/helicase